MDELNIFLMYIHGITPGMAAERRQKEIEREERAAQEASRSKVMEWRNGALISDYERFCGYDKELVLHSHHIHRFVISSRCCILSNFSQSLLPTLV
jgi:hypothetical protein